MIWLAFVGSALSPTVADAGVLRPFVGHGIALAQAGIVDLVRWVAAGVEAGDTFNLTDHTSPEHE